MVDEDNCVFFLPHRPRSEIHGIPLFLFMKGTGIFNVFNFDCCLNFNFNKLSERSHLLITFKIVQSCFLLGLVMLFFLMMYWLCLKILQLCVFPSQGGVVLEQIIMNLCLLIHSLLFLRRKPLLYCKDFGRAVLCDRY